MIEHDNINDLYLAVLEELLSTSTAAAPRGMRTHELLGESLRLYETDRAVISLPARGLNYHFMVAEWWWILTGQDTVASISPYCSEISKFSDDGERFFGAYGPPWRAQFDYVVQKLQADPDTRQAVLTIWRPSPPATKDVPCTVAMQYLLRDGELNTIVTMRSSDAWLGLPYDLFNFSRLGAVVAGALGVRQGWLQVNAGSLHLYERNEEAVERVLDDSDHAKAPDSPDLAPLPGLPPDMARHWETIARTGYIATMEEPWYPYLAVLADRQAKQPQLLPTAWRQLLYPGAA